MKFEKEVLFPAAGIDSSVQTNITPSDFDEAARLRGKRGRATIDQRLKSTRALRCNGCKNMR